MESIDFTNFLKVLNLSEKNLNSRKKEFDKFISLGFPSKKSEDWKFIDLNKIISKKIPNLKFFNELVNVNFHNKNYLKDIPLEIENYNYILSVNGFVKDVNLKYENEDKIELIRENKTLSENTNHSLTHLNNALYFDYLKIVIKEKYIFNQPLIFINLVSDNIESTNINFKFDIVMEKNSSLSLLDFNYDKSENNFINISNHFILRENSILKNYKINLSNNFNLNYSIQNVDIYKNSIFENFLISGGSDLVKNEIICNLKEEFSSAFVNGIINLKKDQQHEIRSKIYHLSENTKSYQLIKCSLKENSKAVYQGKIFVDSSAQKTDGYQLSKAILLNEGTEFNAKPELEIYADDVKCSHGSSSGNLDENKIFYLMTRGLNMQEAKQILLDGFYLEVIEKITDNKIKEIIKILMNIK